MADYDINAVTRRKVFTGSAGTGPYAFTFEILTASDIVVYFNATKLTLTTDFTVAINANGTGSVTIVVNAGGNVPQTPVAADQIVVIGARDIERTTDFVTAGDLLASSLNEQLDALTIFDQQIAEENQRGMRAPPYDPALVEDGGVVDMTLPAKASRAGKTLAFDSDGNPTVGEDIGNWRGDWAAGTAYTVRDLVKDPVNESIYRVNTAHTSSGSAPISGNADVAKFDLVIDATAVADAEAAQAAAEAAQAAAETAQAAAETAETNAETAETNAETAETNAETAKTAAETAKTAAETAQTAAETAETNAETAETNAAASETAAASSATSASTSATTATTQAGIATTKAGEASTSAATSTTQAGIATTKAGEASTSASNAATSETNAATSESNASTSASNAATSATSAANSAASAAASFDSFDDRYLGTKSSDPTVDNDGNALVEGALYFSSTDNEMKVYDGANWIAASSAGSASLILYEYTATSSQTTFSGSDDNSATLSYTANNIQVVMNGVILDPSDYTATNGTSVVLASGAATGDLLNIYAFKSFTVADTVSASAGGTFAANVAITGDLTVDTNTLYVDATNNRVGIGTSSPNKSSSSTALTVNTSSAANYSALELSSGNTLNWHINANNAAVYDVTAGTRPRVFYTNGSERMRLDSSGRLAIGTSSPSDALTVSTSAVNGGVTVSGSTDPQYFLNSSGGNQARFKISDSSSMIQTGSWTNIPVGFYTNGTERVRISSGNLLVGTTTQNGTDGITLKGGGTDPEVMLNKTYSGNINGVRCQHNSTYVGGITYNNTSTAFNTSSDHRLKENVVDMTGAITRVKSLQPKRFNFIADDSVTVDGFIAHEAATVVPEAVTGTHNEVDDDGNPVYQGIDQSKIVPLLVGALNEAIAKIETLETKVAALENA